MNVWLKGIQRNVFCSLVMPMPAQSSFEHWEDSSQTIRRLGRRRALEHLGQSRHLGTRSTLFSGSFIGYNIGNGTLQELTEKSPKSGKRRRKLLLEMEKKKSKKLKSFQKLQE